MYRKMDKKKKDKKNETKRITERKWTKLHKIRENEMKAKEEK